MLASKPIFDMDDTLLKGRSQMENEVKLISRNLLEFLDYMKVVGRDLKKLSLVNTGGRIF